MHYWDTSTLAKLYVNEADSTLFSAHLGATGAISSSELVRWEVFRVLARKEAEGVIPTGATEPIFARFESDVAAGGIALLPMDAATEDRFRKLTLRLHRLSPPVFARTLDGIHLATADLHNAAEFVVADTNLRKCAMAIGLKVYP